ncbi:large ribosomal subunit protein mL49 [Brachionichthys hirsutus]|uniref:large ribosomal subunit protein mL49 n=1 Tax=Brachionichthys hirsutus TaxID=412623 RepID=UPI0036048C2B
MAAFTAGRSALRGLRQLLRAPAGPPAPSRLVAHAAPEDRQTVTESTETYRFVERLIPPTRVPDPPKHAGVAPSGWSAPPAAPPPLPYMIRRSRMHNIPVYTDVTNGSRKMTVIRKVEGDIWALDRDVKHYLKGVTGKELPTQVNDVTMTLKVKGHFDRELKDWLTTRGF